MFIFNIKPLDVGVLPLRRASEPEQTTVCFIVHKTISELEHAILTTLYFAGVENIDRIGGA
jgi:hypothetical protein